MGVVVLCGFLRDQPSEIEANLDRTKVESPESATTPSVLDPTFIPNTVFVVWCGESRWFRFRNYASIMSVVRTMRPDNIVFYYRNRPIVDEMNYNTWFDELVHDYPFFTTLPLQEPEVACDVSTGFPKRSFIEALLAEHGGMYIGEDTMLCRVPKWMMKAGFVNGIKGNNTKRGFLVSQPASKHTIGGKDHVVGCWDVNDSTGRPNDPICAVNDADYSPESVWERDDHFGRIVRKSVYGSPDVARAERSPENVPPYIAHMIWIGGGRMDFLFYLCVLSALHVAKFERVYIHGDVPPTGSYWEKIRTHERLALIVRNSIGMSIWGKRVGRIQHWSDVVRVEILAKYGGVYIDTDLLIVRPFDRRLLEYDAVATYDFPDRSPFPNSFSCGFMIGKRGAAFWSLFQESMRWFRDKNWEWNGLLQPYKVMERHPGLVHIDERLQVICHHGLCHPTWWPDHKNMSSHHLNSGLELNWREDTSIIHLCGRYPTAFHNETAVRHSKDMFGDMGRYILTQAGLL